MVIWYEVYNVSWCNFIFREKSCSNQILPNFCSFLPGFTHVGFPGSIFILALFRVNRFPNKSSTFVVIAQDFSRKTSNPRMNRSDPIPKFANLFKSTRLRSLNGKSIAQLQLFSAGLQGENKTVLLCSQIRRERKSPKHYLHLFSRIFQSFLGNATLIFSSLMLN